jgi:membrane fusion protein (multidrug efflux system)
MTDTNTQPAPDKQSQRRRNLTILAAAVAAGALLWGGWWLFYGRYFESTDDAYVAGDVIMVTAREPGSVLALHADNTQNVKRGELLVELDPAEAQVQFAAARADLARTVRDVQSGFAKVAELRAVYANAETKAAQADADLRRREQPAKDGAISAEDAAHARDAARIATSQAVAAKNALIEAESAVSGTTPATNPAVLAAIARFKNAALALAHTKIVAPLAGAVAQRTVQVGQRVAPGTPLMAIIPLDQVWIDANFKEIQLADMRVGQKVTVTADIYGSVDYHGVVAGLGAGSGNTFALLPPQNASGNWIKIVQRVPVRITLDPDEVRAHPLRLGLSVKVNVDHRDSSGSMLGSTVRPMNAVGVADTADKDADTLIAQILKENTVEALP